MDALPAQKRLMNGELFVVFDILQHLRQRGKLTPLESSIGKIICRLDWFCVYILNLLECQPYMIFKYGLA